MADFLGLMLGLCMCMVGSRVAGLYITCCRVVEPEKIYDKEIVRFQRDMEQNQYDTEASDSLTEPDTDTEKKLLELGHVWTGKYVLGFQSAPKEKMGWTVGKAPISAFAIDLILCTVAAAKMYNIELRNPHAKFSFSSDNLGFYTARSSRSSMAQLSVDGVTVTREPHYLIQHSCKIQASKLEYILEWTDFAIGKDYKDARRVYVEETSGQSHTNVNVEMPTPFLTSTTMGKWTLAHALGRGVSGKVFFGSTTSGGIAAIKLLERTSQNQRFISEEVQTLFELTRLAQESDNEPSILRVVDVVYTTQKEFSPTTAFDSVAIALQPLTSWTLHDLVRNSLPSGHQGMTTEAATAFRSALLGVKFFHNKHWLHGDLKPANIGVAGSGVFTQSVLLDVGGSRKIKADTSLPASPGKGGTIGYLAPERELGDYDFSADIWAMGVILYQLTYHRHPWEFALNPWRSEKQNEELRPAFRTRYQGAIDRMDLDFQNARKSPTNGYKYLGSLFIEMVKYEWPAPENHVQRLSIDEALNHPAWGDLLPNSPQTKRRRV